MRNLSTEFGVPRIEKPIPTDTEGLQYHAFFFFFHNWHLQYGDMDFSEIGFSANVLEFFLYTHNIDDNCFSLLQASPVLNPLAVFEY
jgi:hypothetical protein